MSADRPLFPHEIRAALKSRTIGRRIYYLPEVDSTNRIAVDLAKQGEPDGALIVTDYQTAGRGRHGRRWESSPRSNLLFSVILRPDMPSNAVLPVTLVFAETIAASVGRWIDTPVWVKWPNDVLSPGGKICGILAETSTRSARVVTVVVGVGINVNMPAGEFPDSLDYPAASFRTLTGRRHDRRDVLVDVLSRLDDAYATFVSKGFGAFASAYTQRLWMMGKTVEYCFDAARERGVVEGIELDGGLVVRCGGKRRILYDQEVRVV